MRRRDFVSLLGGAVAGWPLTARGQQRTMPVIGFLSSRSPGESAAEVSAFQEGLQESDYVELQNVTIEYRWAEGHYDRLPALVSELVDRRVSILAAMTTPAALAAKRQLMRFRSSSRLAVIRSSSDSSLVLTGQTVI
jgi:putative ABC transport system substrate-binding protein